jgi:hypothetical protein
VPHATQALFKLRGASGVDVQHGVQMETTVVFQYSVEEIQRWSQCKLCTMTWCTRFAIVGLHFFFVSFLLSFFDQWESHTAAFSLI